MLYSDEKKEIDYTNRQNESKVGNTYKLSGMIRKYEYPQRHTDP